MTESTKRVGGLTANQRAKLFRIARQMGEASSGFWMRLNDTDARSFRARTLAAKRMAELARELYRTVART